MRQSDPRLHRKTSVGEDTGHLSGTSAKASTTLGDGQSMTWVRSVQWHATAKIAIAGTTVC